MPAIRVHDPVLDDADDDDGMPPLVENPGSMTFTFSTDMIPITYSTDPTSFEVLSPEQTASLSPTLHVIESECSPASPKASHAKKRDSSYIPRPPNAFILFRSSFIRSQQVPGKVEGNHSTLSKIVGMLWKSLPREERKIWEAKALVALAEHRKRYPDWRFRPANALAKLKTKDGGGTHRRRTSHGRKVKDDNAEEKEKRCAKIADLLVEGKKGSALAAAVRAWECNGNNLDNTSLADVGIALYGDRKDSIQQSDKKAEQILQTGPGLGPISIDVKTTFDKSAAGLGGLTTYMSRADGDSLAPAFYPAPRSQTPGRVSEARFKVPLDSMFRRSLSAPASMFRAHCADATGAVRRPDFQDPSSPTESQFCQSPVARFFVFSDKQHMEYGGAHEHHGYEQSLASPTTYGDSLWESQQQSFSYMEREVPETPVLPTTMFPSIVDPDADVCAPSKYAPPSVYPNEDCELYAHPCGYTSSYSTLRGWAGVSAVSPDKSSPYSNSADQVNAHVLRGGRGVVIDGDPSSIGPNDLDGLNMRYIRNLQLYQRLAQEFGRHGGIETTGLQFV